MLQEESDDLFLCHGQISRKKIKKVVIFHITPFYFDRSAKFLKNKGIVSIPLKKFRRG